MIGMGLYWMIGISVVTPFLGVLLKWGIEIFLTEREASIASFSLVLGNSLGSLLFIDFSNYVWVTEQIGVVIGLCVLWWFLFRRKAVEG